MIFIKVDSEGFYIETVWIEQHEEIPENCIFPYTSDKAFYKPKYDFIKKEWVEGLTEIEIAEIKKQQPQPVPTIEEMQAENQELKNQIQSVSKDFQDFMDFFFNQ